MISRTAPVWEKVATRLYFERHDILTIQGNKLQAEDACRTMFVEWLEGKGRTPTTWETVIKALDESELAEVAENLRNVITTYQLVWSKEEIGNVTACSHYCYTVAAYSNVLHY